MRAINDKSPRHREWLPHRDYESKDVSFLEPEQKYDLLVEIWPTQVVVEEGGKIVLEVATGDSQGCGIFLHNEETDRYVNVMALYMLDADPFRCLQE